jgi:hypothetical protein
MRFCSGGTESVRGRQRLYFCLLQERSPNNEPCLDFFISWPQIHIRASCRYCDLFPELYDQTSSWYISSIL